MVSLAGIPCWDHLLNNWVLASAVIIAAAVVFCLRPYFFPAARLRTHLFIFAGLVLAAVGLFAWQDVRENLRAEKLDALKRFNAEANQLFEESLHVGRDDYAA